MKFPSNVNRDGIMVSGTGSQAIEWHQFRDQLHTVCPVEERNTDVSRKPPTSKRAIRVETFQGQE